MMRSRSLAAVLLLLAFALVSTGPADAFARKWDDGKGHQIEAKFVRVFDGNVILTRGGRVVTLPLTKLADGDRRYVEAKVAGLSDLKAEQAAKAALPGQDIPSLSGLDCPRKWTDGQGNQVTATFVRVSDANLVLSRDGRETAYPFVNFSDADRQYVRNELKTRGEDHLLPAETVKTTTSSRPSAMASRMSPGPGGLRHPFPSSFPGMPQMPDMPEMPDMPTIDTHRMTSGMPDMTSGMPDMSSMPDMPNMSSGMPDMSLGSRHPSASHRSSMERSSMESSSSPSPSMETTSTAEPPRMSERSGMPEMPRMPGRSRMPGMSGPALPNHPRMSGGNRPEWATPDLKASSGASHQTSQTSERYVGECSGCGGAVPAHLGAGDKCPHCGILFEYEELADGSFRNAQGQKVSNSWVKIGGGGGLVAIVIALILGVLRIAGWRN